MQLVAVRLGLTVLGTDFAVAQGVGVFMAMTTNFLLNNRITYRDRRLRRGALLRGLLTFYMVCSLGAVANIAIARFAFHLLPIWFVASAIGSVTGAMWNFWASLMTTWRPR